MPVYACSDSEEARMTISINEYRTKTMNYKECYNEIVNLLNKSNVKEAGLDARLLLEFVCGTDRSKGGKFRRRGKVMAARETEMPKGTASVYYRRAGIHGAFL